jgi:5-methylcytosine-specific restriction endonuclease McrA
MAHALVLNASFEPLQIVTWQRAIQLLFLGKVEVIEESEEEVHTVRMTIRVPAVLRLLEYIPLKKRKQIVRFSRTNVFIRDRYRCQYCGTAFLKSHLTLDHVMPVVQGGGKNWDNIVTACKPCNQKKGGRTPQQAKMNLIRPPFRPNWLPATAIRMTVSKTPDRWKLYLSLVREETKGEKDLDDSS